MEAQYMVWWIPQVPMPAFHVPVRNLEQAKLLLEALAQYDIFQFVNKVKPEYSNTGGLLSLQDCGDGLEWLDWEHEETGDGIGDLTMQECIALDAGHVYAQEAK